MSLKQQKQELKAAWPKGCPAPSGYVDWHDWAAAQSLHGLRSKQCKRCKKWHFPQEVADHECKPAKRLGSQE